jgi:hypothetical protein
MNDKSGDINSIVLAPGNSVHEWFLIVFPRTSKPMLECLETASSQMNQTSIGPKWVGFYKRKETESSLRNLAFWIKKRTMDYVQKHNNCINIPSLQILNQVLRD